jgi:hypothetical protein
MHEAQPRHTGLASERPVHGDAVDLRAVFLAIVEADHRDRVAVRSEQPRQDALLDLGAPDLRDMRVARDHGPGVRRDKAHVRPRGRELLRALRRGGA